MPASKDPGSYIIRSSLWYLNDTPERIEYHIKNDDYLPLLATMMGFMEEALRLNDTDAVNARKSELALALAKELREDLRFVSAHYTLVPRNPEDIREIRSGNVLGS